MSRGRGEGGGGGAPAEWRQAQPHRLHLRLRLLRCPAGPEPSHYSFWSTPSVCVPASLRLGSRMMTLKASEGEGGGSMRTALSDLYLEHLLQKRSRPEVSGPRGCQGRGVRGQDPAPGALPAAGPPLSTALPLRACPRGSCPRDEGRGGQQGVLEFRVCRVVAISSQPF